MRSALAQVDGTDLVDAAAGSLSGGNQQKLLFARSLLIDPSVLIADEPTRGIDVGAKRDIYEVLVKLAGGRTGDPADLERGRGDPGPGASGAGDARRAPGGGADRCGHDGGGDRGRAFGTAGSSAA